MGTVPATTARAETTRASVARRPTWAPCQQQPPAQKRQGRRWQGGRHGHRASNNRPRRNDKGVGGKEADKGGAAKSGGTKARTPCPIALAGMYYLRPLLEARAADFQFLF